MVRYSYLNESFLNQKPEVIIYVMKWAYLREALNKIFLYINCLIKAFNFSSNDKQDFNAWIRWSKRASIFWAWSSILLRWWTGGKSLNDTQDNGKLQFPSLVGGKIIMEYASIKLESRYSSFLWLRDLKRSHHIMPPTWMVRSLKTGTCTFLKWWFDFLDKMF